MRAHTRAFRARHTLVGRYSFAVPSEEALTLIASHAPIVQMGAGTGYWAWLLQRDYGVDILPYDNAPPSGGGNYWFRKTGEWVPIRFGTPETLAQYPDRTLFLCWPPMDTMAVDCLQHYQGRTVIYIGEEDGGCTGNDAFFARLEAEWEETSDVDIPQWDGIHDYLTVYQRKEKGVNQMPMDFPDFQSLEDAARLWKFRDTNHGETEVEFRLALARHVQPKDPIEAHEIRTGKGWDQWTDEEKRDLLTRVSSSPRPWHP